MYNFKDTLQTKNVTPGVNTRQYIICHHTGSKEGTLRGNLNALLGLSGRQVSAHFLIDTNGDTYKLAQPTDITRHAGDSKWGKLIGMNKYSLGIEMIGPLSDGGFTMEQKVAMKQLIRYLMQTFKIPRENVLRHRDITTRKVDIADSFFAPKYLTWKDYQNSL